MDSVNSVLKMTISYDDLNLTSRYDENESKAMKFMHE